MKQQIEDERRDILPLEKSYSDQLKLNCLFCLAPLVTAGIAWLIGLSSSWFECEPLREYNLTESGHLHPNDMICFSPHDVTVVGCIGGTCLLSVVQLFLFLYKWANSNEIIFDLYQRCQKK